MRTIKSLRYLSVAIFLIFVSCNKEPVPSSMSDGGIISIDPSTSLLTKAPIGGTTFPTSRTLVMSAYYNAPSGGTSKNYFSGVTFSHSGSSWLGGKRWPSDGSLNLFAYSVDGLNNVTASYKTNASQGVTLTVPDNSSAQTDILWGYKSSATGSGGATAITMRHAEASLAFTAKAATAYDATNNLGITITGITVNSVNCSGKVTLNNSESCSWSSLSTSKNLSLPGLSGGYHVPAQAMSIDSSNPFGIGGVGLIVLPQNATSVTVTYTAHNGRNGSGSAINTTGLTSTTTLSGSWTAGKRYVMAIEFAENMSISATVFEWTSGTGSMPVQKTVSATYSVPSVRDITLPDATLSAGAIVSVDWGDGLSETYQASSSKAISMKHTYSSSYSGNVKFIVHNGTIDFGEVKSADFQKFTVNEGGKVIISEKQGPAGMLFTVNSSGKKVIFAPGNLLWNGTSFEFEENDYDYPTSWNSNYVGHFYYNVKASDARASSYNSSGRTTSDVFFAANGGAIEGWTVLTKDEWDYVINNHLGKYRVSINGKYCAVLVPDGVAASVVADSYSAAEWAAAKAQSGLVALPFAGYRDGTSFGSGGSLGGYWSCSPYSGGSGYAWYAYFDSSGAGTGDGGRGYGRSVRLVSVQ